MRVATLAILPRGGDAIIFQQRESPKVAHLAAVLLLYAKCCIIYSSPYGIHGQVQLGLNVKDKEQLR